MARSASKDAGRNCRGDRPQVARRMNSSHGRESPSVELTPSRILKYLLGSPHVNNKISLDKSIKCFEQALEKDPDYAAAHAALAVESSFES